MTFEQLASHFSPHLGHCSTSHESLTTLAAVGGSHLYSQHSERLLHEDPHELEVTHCGTHSKVPSYPGLESETLSPKGKIHSLRVGLL